MSKSYCYNCGEMTNYSHIYPIDESLKETWQINSQLTKLFNRREGSLCDVCGASIRAQGLARAIVQSRFGYGSKSLKEWVVKANRHGLSVCELNSCHKLHDILSGLKGLTYSEYGTDSEQNIEQLTYKDNTFDLVLHSETLEHVSNPRQAMNECRRVLKKDGLVLFTTPIIWNRNTRQRSKIVNNKIKKILPESHHGYKTDDYLVFYEYGRDADELVGAGVALNDWRNQNYVFFSDKIPTTIDANTKLKLQLQQNISIWSKKVSA